MSDAPIHVDDVEEQHWELGDELEAYRKRLGPLVNAKRLGIAIMRIPPGKRPNPPHSHADEEEQFFVLEGSGLSYQTSGSKDTHTYEIRKGDFLVHPAGGPAHTMIAGPDGLTVLIVAEGTRTNITWLPRTKMFWLGSRFVPADGAPPFHAEVAAGPLELPDPSPRPRHLIANLEELEIEEGREGDLAYATRFLTDRSAQLVLAHDQMPPNTFNTELHFHSTREEAWYVLSGTGTWHLGDERHPLRPGSFFLRRPNGGVGHKVEVGPDGMELITMGDLVDADIAVYPDRGVARIAKGVEVPYTPK